jgi:hypothetical protein
MQFLAMKTQKRLLGLLAALALVCTTGAFAQTPANDDFANRTVLSGSSISFGGSLAGATLETGDTNNAFYWIGTGASGSVWWTWTAPESTTAVIWFTGPSSGTNRLAIYSGTNFGGLTAINYLYPPVGRYMTFDATAGTAYQIQVIGTDTQPFTAQLTATNPPVFVFQPKDCTVSPYGSAVFSAMASEPPYPSTSRNTYQWYFNGVPLPGQTFPSLLIHGVTTNQAGTYSVTASNIGGVMAGGSATLTVTDTNPVPRLAVLPPNGPNLRFNLTGEPGRWYKVESSTNLQNWTNASWLQLTEPTTLVSIQRLGPTHFVRASLDAPTDVCIAQLKQMRWAGRIFMIETMQPEVATVGISDIVPYLPITNYSPPFCPEDGIYSSNWTVTNRPTCTLEFQGRGHLISNSP